VPEDAESRSVVVTIGGPTQASSVAASRAPPSVPDDPELPDELDEELEPPDDPEEPEEEPEEPEEEPDEEPELPEELDEPVFPDDVPEPSASSSSAPRAHPAADARDAERAKARSKREGTILRCYARIWDFFPQCQNAPRPGRWGSGQGEAMKKSVPGAGTKAPLAFSTRYAYWSPASRGHKLGWMCRYQSLRAAHR